MSYNVKLIFYKNYGGYHGKGGKYYADGEYTSELEDLGAIWDEVEQKRLDGDLPGLCKSFKPHEFHISISVPEHPQAHPRMIII